MLDGITEEEEENNPLMRIHFNSDPQPFATGEARDFSVAVDQVTKMMHGSCHSMFMFMSYHIKSCHVMSWHVMAYHVPSYHVM